MNELKEETKQTILDFKTIVAERIKTLAEFQDTNRISVCVKLLELIMKFEEGFPSLRGAIDIDSIVAKYEKERR